VPSTARPDVRSGAAVPADVIEEIRASTAIGAYPDTRRLARTGKADSDKSCAGGFATSSSTWAPMNLDADARSDGDFDLLRAGSPRCASESARSDESRTRPTMITGLVARLGEEPSNEAL